MRFVVSLGILLGSLWLSGCVTTTNDPAKNIDKKKSLETHIELGLGYLRQKDNDAARLHLNKALEIDSASAGALNGMALVYQAESQNDKAEEHYLRALRADPNFSQARNNYGAFLFGKERYKEALKQFQIVTEDISYPLRSMVLVNYGRTALRLGQLDEAKRAFNQAIGVNYKTAPAYLELADIAFNAGNYPEAKSYHDQYSKLSRQSARGLWLGIRLERMFGNKDKEASYALALRNLYPSSAEYLQYQQSVAPNEQP